MIAGASPNTTNRGGTPVHIASKFWIKGNGVGPLGQVADKNALDSRGRSPLCVRCVKFFGDTPLTFKAGTDRRGSPGAGYLAAVISLLARCRCRDPRYPRLNGARHAR